ncbi:hypothetical protein [Pseudoroseicyclus tamaricis]|uniref:Uncharacterized protein n=1 Tax=Pseudoroseicyclus tamaricis TaxID=2705421 RepID=A0A6B2K0V2_9RHOB|nr:hypothetical protein [Pseudoroseicyclus tamaricis]NDV02064.1 hypothetical protein [Pseudoroseicyclus tamaricis]
MDELLRPEARAALLRWREALLGAALCALALLGAWQSYGLTRWVALFLALVGLALALAGLQRGRFRGAGGGLGVVELDEGRLSWLGPRGGSSVSMGELAVLEYHPAEGLTPERWRLTDKTGNELLVPANAAGIERLFDACATLPGLSPARLGAARRAGMPVRLWPEQVSLARRLH